MLVLSVVDEEDSPEKTKKSALIFQINADFFVFSGLSCSFHDDLVGGRVDVLEVVLLV